MGVLQQRAVTASALVCALLLSGRAFAAPDSKHDTVADSKDQATLDARATQDCNNVPATPGPIPDWYVERCLTHTQSKPVVSQDPYGSRTPSVVQGPILLQETSTNTVNKSSVGGIATLTSFGALVPTSTTDFPADLIRLVGDQLNVYQITSSGAVSRYDSSGVNTVLAPIGPPAGNTWTDTATDPTSGIVYAASASATCTNSTLSTLNVLGGTTVTVGVISATACIVGLAADNAGNLWGVDIVGDNLYSINKVTGAGTLVGSLGFNSNYGQGMDCNPANGVCYMFTVNFGNANSADLRTINTATGATTLVAVIGTASPGGAVQVPGAVFETMGNCSTDAECSDGDLCTGTETCVANLCTPGTPVNCDDGLFCTIDSCAPATGACSHAPNPCSDGDPCTTDACDEGTHTCTHSGAPVHICSSGATSIPSVGTGTPYPSSITVAGLGTNASVCSVQLNGLSHTWPDDIDILLVGPAAPSPNAIIMSDCGGSTPLVGVNLTLSDAAANPLPDTGGIPSGTYKPTNYGAGDAFAAPAPAPSGGSALSAFSGLNPNGVWKLFVVDDVAGDSGTLSQWCVNIVVSQCTTNADCSDGNLCNGVETCVNNNCVPGTPVNCDDGQFCTIDSCDPPTGNCLHAPNPCSDGDLCTPDSCDEVNDVCVHGANACVQVCNAGAIAINDSAAPPTLATPYPSTITVAGAVGIFTLASVDLSGIGHTYPDDIDILLAAPGTPTTATLMSDVGGSTAVVGINLHLTDGAPPLPDAGPLVSGTFAPTNVDNLDTWPAPAPAPTGGTTLSSFNGTNPNGNWNLFVVDDAGADSGTIANGWCLNYLLTCSTASDCDDSDSCSVDSCVNGFCTHSPVLTPGAVSGVTAASDKQTYSWSAEPNSTRYDVLRGDLSALPVGPGGGDEVCFDNLLVSVLMDPATPAPGDGYWYVVRGENSCTNGSYGTDSIGNPRISTTCP
jgi:subtilisin-like proprotein convertase family protein